MKGKYWVLVLTGYEDPMWPFLFNACSAEEKNKIILFPTDQPKIAKCTYNPIDKQIEFHVKEKIIQGSNLRGIWWRRIVPPNLDHLPRDLKEYCIKEHNDFFEGLEYLLPKVVWVSKPSAITRAKNKAYQLRLAKELGFNTLQTIFTNSPEALVEFSRSSDAVYKSIRSPRIPIHEDKHSTVFTTLLDDKHLSKAEGIMSCPGILQRYCPKIADIRVSVFGQNLFAVRIESQLKESSQIDFRLGARNLPHLPHTLPIGTADICIKLVANLGLNFGAIDLALLEDNSYIFFEINPNGQWGWLEEKTGLPMRRALLDILFQKAKG